MTTDTVSALRDRARQTLDTYQRDLGTPREGASKARYEDARDELDIAVKARDHQLDALLNGSPSNDFRNPLDAGPVSSKTAPGSELNGIWPTFADLVKDLRSAAIARKGAPAAFKELSSGTDAAGGYLVPSEHLAQLMRLSVEREVVRPRAFVVPATSDQLLVPRIDETTRAAGAVHGAVDAVWTAEGATISEADPTFGELPMTINKLALRTVVPNELMDDSNPALATILPRLFSDAVRFALDSAFLTGNGVGRPLGAFHAVNGAMVTVQRAVASQIAWGDIEGMYERLLPESTSTAVWIANQSVIPQLFSMVVGNAPIFVQAGAATAPPTLLGLPLIFSEHMSALGTAGDLVLVDLQKYVIADRAQLNIRVSEHEKFSEDKTVIRGTLRIDGRPWMASALTPANGGSTVSAYIRLGDPA